MIRHKMLNTAVNTILSQNDEEKCWSLYLSCVANPLADDMSFDDFLKKFGTRNAQIEQGSNKKTNKPEKLDLKKQVVNAEKILKNFVPPNKKGGGMNGS